MVVGRWINCKSLTRGQKEGFSKTSDVSSSNLILLNKDCLLRKEMEEAEILPKQRKKWQGYL